MNKLFTKIAMAFIGASMAIGVGVAIGTNKEAISANASTGSYTFTFDSNTKADGTGNHSTADRGDAFTTSNFATSGTLSFNLSGTTYYWRCNGYSNISSVSSTTNTYAGKNQTIKVGKAKGDGTLNFTVVGGSNLSIDSVVVTAYGSTSSAKIKIAEATAATKTWTLSTSSDSHTFTYDSAVKTVSITGGDGKTSSNPVAYISQIVVNYTEASTTQYTVGGTISNGALSSTASVDSGSALNVTLNPSEHYHLPTSLTSVTMGGNALVAGTGYTYNNSTGAIYIASVTGNVLINASCVEDAKYTVTYVKGDHGTGSNYVVSNQYAGSYTLVTFATAGFTEDDGYSFSKWNVGGTEYAEGASITISGNTTVTAVYVQTKEFNLFSGSIVEGDYLVYYSGKAMKASISSNRFEYVSFTPSNNKILTSDTSVIWHIASSGTYWTMYNASVNKYAASTGAASKGQLLASGSDDMSLWTVSGSSTYEFVNKKNTANSVNANLRNNGTYGFACYGTGTGGALSLYRLKVLTSVSSSGHTTSFTNGANFSYGGTLTATYSNGSNKTVTPTSYKIGASGIDPTSAGTTITTSTALSMSDSGKYIYVIYTDSEGTTKYTSYQISVNYAAVTDVSISTKVTEMGNDASFTFGATVSPSTANQSVTWSVEDKTGTLVEDGEAEIIESTGELTVASYNTGTLTVTATTVGKNSSSVSLTTSVDVDITGDPVVAVTSELAGYSGKNTDLAYSFSNFIGSLSVISSDTSKVTVGTPTATTAPSGSGTVQVNFVDAGSSTLTFKDGDTAVATCAVTVTASAVTSVTWSNSSNMTVYSGSTALNASKVTEWAPKFEKNNGDKGNVTSDYTVKLNGSSYTLGTALTAGTYTVTLTYGGVTTSTSNPVVTVIQSLNTITGNFEYSHTFISGEVYSSGYQTTVTDSNATWGIAYTWASSAPNSGSVDATKGQQIGTGSNPATSVVFSSSSFASSAVTSIKVNASGANDIVGSLSVTVNGTTYKNGNNDSATLTNSAADYTFTGNSSGDIAITLSQTSSKALYIKSIEVKYTSTLTDSSSHTSAQAAVVTFAQYMNAQMNGTKVCTGDMSNLGTAWGNVADKYDELFGASTALSSSELKHAKAMLTNATASWNEEHDSDEKYCLERAMATYEWCVSHYSSTCTAFMSAVRPIEANHTNPILSVFKADSANLATVMIVISMITATAIGGYFFLKKRKEER